MNDFRVTLHMQQLQNDVIGFSENVKYSFSKQYERDSFFYQEGTSWLLFIGVCYNKKNLLSNEKSDWKQNFWRLFNKNHKAFLEQVDGYFSGIYYDSKKKDILLFTDHLTSIPVYYYRNSDYFIVDTDLIRLASELRRLNISLRMSEFGAYCMLAYSFMLDSITPLENVYKVRPASCYYFRRDCTEKYFEYYNIEKDTSTSSIEIAEGIHELFSDAVKNSFDLDGNEAHLVTLSGGLDSRMCLLYALKQGYRNITTLNYSQSFYREETIAKKIAADYHCEHVFFSLDNGNYLSYIDEGIRATQGMTTYRPILSARMIWKRLHMDQFNFVHTGLLGDTILGGYCIDKCNSDNRFHSSLDLAIQLNPKNHSIITSQYKDMFLPFFERVSDWIPTKTLKEIESEKYILDNRYINGLMQSALGTRGLTVVSSPYTGKKMMKYIFSFPSKIRLNHELYFTWMNNYLPEAAYYEWENTGLKPMYGKIAIKPHSKIVQKLKYIDSVINQAKPERTRNPYDYWMKHNDNIQKELISYCLEKQFLLSDNLEILEISKNILACNNIYLLIRLATLLGFIYMCEYDNERRNYDSTN